MKKGFTLIEGLVMGIIVITVLTLAFSFSHMHSNYTDGDYLDYAAPDISRSLHQRKMADEMQRANDLKERELMLKENKQNKQ